LVESAHQLDLPEELDEFILGELRILHHFEGYHAPGFLALRLGNATVTAFSDKIKNFVLF
jgi:hypothetical protein